MIKLLGNKWYISSHLLHFYHQCFYNFATVYPKTYFFVFMRHKDVINTWVKVMVNLQSVIGITRINIRYKEKYLIMQKYQFII